ncbi:MAG TPA: dihydrofolate reductase [Candidatus Limnocylindria bacterium]|nr:dihydrofolate reductase [Candidatus Limnocylindria bacterium]
MSRISFVVAVGRNKVIGKDGRLPWRLPDDMKHVRAVTMGKPLIMGRRTYDSIGHPLKGRTNIVLTRDPAFHPEGVLVARSPEEALRLAGDAPEIIVFGGAQIYKEFLPMADRMYMTGVDADVEGDTYFDMGKDDWRVVKNERHEADDRHKYAFNILVLDRITHR